MTDRSLLFSGLPCLCDLNSLACSTPLLSALLCQCRNSSRGTLSDGLQGSWKRPCLPHWAGRVWWDLHPPPLVSRHLLHISTARLPSPSTMRSLHSLTTSLAVSSVVTTLFMVIIQPFLDTTGQTRHKWFLETPGGLLGFFHHRWWTQDEVTLGKNVCQMP